MTQVDFYILHDSPPAGMLDFACKMCEKIYRLGHAVYIQTNSAQQADELDQKLWTYRQGSFVPHTVLKTPQSSHEEICEPVMIGYSESSPICSTTTENMADNKSGQVMINLSDEIPVFFNDFERITEIVVKKDVNTKNRARERYRFYREQGCTLDTHDITG